MSISAEEVHALRSDVDFAFVPGAVQAAELRVRDELLDGLLRQVAVPACNVHPTDTELSNLPVGQWLELVRLEDDVGDIGEWRSNCDGLPRPQTLAARVGARLCGSVSVDDLPSAPGPGLHERAGEGFARRNDVAAQRIGQIQFGGWCEGGEQHRRTEEHRDLGFSEDGDEVRAGSDLLLGQHDHSAARHPGAVHLRDAAIVAQRRSERGCVHARKEIEVIGVAQGKVHVTCVRALDSLGHPSGAARVKDGRKALRGVVQPRRRFPAGHPLRQRQDVECRQVAELVLPPRQNDYRLCVVEHVGDQGVGQRGIQEHHCAASLENAQVRGHDLPIVLRHGHGHDLVGSCEEGRKGRGHALCSRVEFSEAQGFSGVGNLQGR